MVQVTRVSFLDDVERTIEIPLTESEFNAAFAEWKSGVLIQNAFPMLTPSEREFIMSGITDDQWKDIFSADDSEEN